MCLCCAAVCNFKLCACIRLWSKILPKEKKIRMYTIKAKPHNLINTSTHRPNMLPPSLTCANTHTQSDLGVGSCLWACGLWTASQTPVCSNSPSEIQLSGCLNYSNSNRLKERRNTHTRGQKPDGQTHRLGWKCKAHLSFNLQKFSGKLVLVSYLSQTSSSPPWDLTLEIVQELILQPSRLSEFFDFIYRLNAFCKNSYVEKNFWLSFLQLTLSWMTFNPHEKVVWNCVFDFTVKTYLKFFLQNNHTGTDVQC